MEHPPSSREHLPPTPREAPAPQVNRCSNSTSSKDLLLQVNNPTKDLLPLNNNPVINSNSRVNSNNKGNNSCKSLPRRQTT